MKWTEDEKEEVKKLFKEGHIFEEIGLKTNRTKDSIRGFLNKLGYKQSDFAIKNYYHIKECLECKNEFKRLISHDGKFCSHSCSTKYNNKIKGKKTITHNTLCIICGRNKKSKVGNYCSNTCKSIFDRKEIFHKIENGDLTLGERWYKKYLIIKYGEKCMDCGWNKVHPITGNIPIQMDHIDGNAENNNLVNLHLLCPNCHSLTPTYGNLNKGNGRKNRY